MKSICKDIDQYSRPADIVRDWQKFHPKMMPKAGRSRVSDHLGQSGFPPGPYLPQWCPQVGQLWLGPDRHERSRSRTDWTTPHRLSRTMLAGFGREGPGHTRRRRGVRAVGPESSLHTSRPPFEPQPSESAEFHSFDRSTCFRSFRISVPFWKRAASCAYSTWSGTPERYGRVLLESSLERPRWTLARVGGTHNGRKRGS